MIAHLRNGFLMALYATEDEAKPHVLEGDELKPAGFGNVDPGVLKLQVKFTLEKFEGDVQSPETLIETIEGEG